MKNARWKATLASALCMAGGMSAIFMGSFPVFLESVSRDLGWGRATFPQVITVASITAALLMPFGGRMVDRFGVRWPVFIGLLLVAGGMALLSTIEDAGAAFWLAALAIGAGSAISGPPSYVALISSWYDRNRALAIACILSVAPACAQTVVSPVTQYLIAEFGWRYAYCALAAFIALVSLIAASGALRPRGTDHATPPCPGGSSTAREAMRTPAFWLLAISGCLGSGTMLGLTAHVVAWQTGRGVPPDAAALVLSALFFSGIAGAFLSGYIADRARDVRVLQIFYAAPLAGLLLMATTTWAPALGLGAALIGIGMSSSTGLSAFLTTRYFGLKTSAEVFGIILGMTMISLGAAPVLIGLGYDATGSYTLPMSLAALSIAVATISVGLLRRVASNSDYSVASVRPACVFEE